MPRPPLLAAIALALAVLSPGQPARATQATAPPLPPAHRLQAGDSLRVTVTPQGPPYSREVKVLSDGRIYYPVVGEIYVVGKTIVELTRIIQEGLTKELQGHRVTVEPLQYAENPKGVAAPDPAPLGRVAVVGAVGQPGTVALPENPRLAELVTRAGGLAPSADLSRVVVSRDDLTQVAVDPRSELGRAFRLRAGDVIIVPGAPSEMRLGSVQGFEGLEPDAVRPVGAAAADALKGSQLRSAAFDAGSLFQLVPDRSLGYRSGGAAFVLVPDAALLRRKSVADDWQLLPVGLLVTRGVTLGTDPALPLAQAATLSVPSGPQDLAVFFVVARRTREGGRLEVYGAGKDPLFDAPLAATPAGQDLPIAFRDMQRAQTSAEFRLPGRLSGVLRLLVLPPPPG